MTEILTESFCERCGTRYTFESVAPKQHRMGGIRVLGRGLKNFVLSDDSSLDEAMAAARSDEEREATAQQLDAFHRTFNFCMSCRQYTCGNCWNGVEARCLSCSPLLEAEVAAAAAFAAPTGEVDLERLLRLTAPAAEAAWPAAEVEPEAAWPAAEVEPELVGEAEVAARAGAATEVPEAAEATDAAEAEALEAVEPAAAVEAEAVPAPELPAWARETPWVPEAAEAPGTEPEEAAAEPALRGLEPGESLDDAIAAYEAAEAEAAQAEAAGPAPAEAEPTEAITAEAEPMPADAAPAARGIDIVAQPTWPTSPQVIEPEAVPIEVAEVAELAPPEPVAAEPEPEPVAAAPEPPAAPVAAEPAPEPEPIAAEPEPVAAAAPPAPTPEPEVPAPVFPPPVFPPAAPHAPAEAPSGPPQWPTGPRWPTGVPARQAVPPPPDQVADPLAAIMARQATEAMWAASSRDVVQPPIAAQVVPSAAVQPCVNCGISLSANARFCRRCGTSQAG